MSCHTATHEYSSTTQVPVPDPSEHKAAVPPPASEPVYDPAAPELNAPLPVLPNGEDESESDDAEPPYDDQDDLPLFPITHELVLKDHTKVVSALTLDPSGARVLSGSHDYDCKLWDFGGMSASAKPFKTWEPAGSYYVHDLKYSNAGDQFLCISGTSQAKLYDRDGEEKCVYIYAFMVFRISSGSFVFRMEFIKGDPYIRDMKNTAYVRIVSGGKCVID